MEKGHFQPMNKEYEIFDKDIGPQAFADSSPEGIALPTQMPEPVNLSQLSGEILKSQTINALIQQNDDLMARLSVALRRSAHLEEIVENTEASQIALKHDYQILKEQVLVLKEKDRLVADRTHKVDAHLEQAKARIEVLEKEYTQLYTESRTKHQSLLNQIDSLVLRLSQHIKYRRHIRRISSHLRLQTQQHLSTIESLKLESQDLKQKMSETIERIQVMNKEHRQTQNELKLSYDNQLEQLHQDYNNLKDLHKKAQAKAEKYDELHTKAIDLENQLIRERRERSSQQSTFEKEREELQSQIVHFRQDNKTKTIALESRQQEVTHLEAQVKQLIEDKTILVDQVESLQCLWKESQNQNERLNEKHQALQKLNQQLSTSLNQLRKENQNLKNAFDSHQINTQEQIKIQAHKTTY